jgi:broad specificity phosphatase PhoE
MAQAPTSTRLIMVRHARTAYNASGRFRGLADVPLDEVGVEQAKALAHRIAREEHVTQLFTSPLLRALHTADAIADECKLAAVVEPRLIDVDYGEWQGLTVDEVMNCDAQRYQAWCQAPDRVPLPGGGRIGSSVRAALRFVKEAIADYPGETTVFVTHDVICQGLACLLLDIPMRRMRDLQFLPASISVFSITGPECRLESLADTAHLVCAGIEAPRGSHALTQSASVS